jgi:hypothetical protein
MADDPIDFDLSNQRPFLECRNCPTRIVLQLPSPEEISSLPKVLLSKTWHRTFLCLTCAHMYVYRVRDLQFYPPRKHDQEQCHTGHDDHPESFPISIAETACGHEGCTGRLRFHIAADLSEPTSRTAAAIDALSKATLHDIYCDQGHQASHLVPWKLLPPTPMLDFEWWIDS